MWRVKQTKETNPRCCQASTKIWPDHKTYTKGGANFGEISGTVFGRTYVGNNGASNTQVTASNTIESTCKEE